MPGMRTTVDIEDDLLKQLKELAHGSGCSMKKMINTALRRGLEALEHPHRGGRRRYRCPTYSMGQPTSATDLDKALALADALEDEGVLRKLQLRK